MSRETQSNRPQRAGGRKARQALRAAPLAEDVKPVRGGIRGGDYLPLTQEDCKRIHETALNALETIGIVDAPQSGVDAMVASGAVQGDDGRVRIPRALVEDMVSKAGRGFALCGQDSKHDLQPGGSRVYYGTAGAAVHLVDVESRTYRESTLRDLYDAARITDTLEHVHYFQRCMVARDMTNSREMDFNTCYASVSGTTKHVGTSFVAPDHVQESLAMLYQIAGSEQAYRSRPFVSLSCTFVVPPLKFATESCQVMEEAIRGGMPVLLLSAGQAGATAPAAIAGTIAQAVAECLAGVVYVNSISPGFPAVFGPWPFVSDLRTGAMSGGSGEQALLSAACGQMAHFYDLPGGSAAGMTDAKLPDQQAGYEKGISNVMAGLSGTSMIYESAGMHASLMGFCFESLLIDNDLIGQSLRCVRGIEVNDERLSLEVMRQVCLEGPGHYLGHAQTLDLMQREYLYPELANRSSPKEWVEEERPDIVEQASKEKQRILSEYFPDHIPDALDDSLRENFPVRLPREVMKP